VKNRCPCIFEPQVNKRESIVKDINESIPISVSYRSGSEPIPKAHCELGIRPEINRQRCAGIEVPAKEAMKDFTRGKRLKSVTPDRTSRPSRFDDLVLAESLGG
jgi:hypothetical protein